MTAILEGQRFWKTGDHTHVWIVDAVIPARGAQPAFVVLVSEDGSATEDVDLSHLGDPEQFVPAP
ncbi:MAG: hypothetical protein ACE5DS_02000 [Kiloniellaceae bacterium]